MRLTLGVVAAVASTLVADAPAQTLAPNSGARVSGRIATAYAEMVADATVTLERLDQTEVSVDRWTARSDSEGGFSFPGVAAGRYRLSALKPGYTDRRPSPVEVGDRTDGVTEGRFDAGLEVNVSDGQQALDIDLLLYRASSIAGRIINPDGSAAGGVQVLVASRARDGRLALFDAGTTSEWDGRYTITGLPPGEFLVAAAHSPVRFDGALAPIEGQVVAGRSPGGASGARRTIDPKRTSRWTLYPGVPETEPGTVVTLLEGIATEGIDIWLTPAQRFTVSGRVFWPSGVVVENITIDYGDPAGTQSGIWYVSDPGGLFTLTGVAPGPLVLLARAETDQGSLVGIASTAVAVDSVEDVRIDVDRPGHVEGRVRYEDDPGPALRATTISLVQTLFKVSALYPVSEAAVAADGRFHLENALGEYAFEFRGLPAGYVVTRVLRNGLPTRASRLSILKGESVADVEVVVAKQSASDTTR